MSTTPRPRPLSPFMIGPYYKAQLTSMLSITHRGTGVFLTFGGLVLAWWLAALAGGPGSYARFAGFADSLPGRLILLALAFSLIFHLLNGIRHLFWDAGMGLDVPRAYATGWSVLFGSLAATAIVAWLAFGGAA